MRYNVSVSNAISVTLPWVPEVFLACGGYFPCWPKAEATSGKPREKNVSRGSL